MSPLADDIGSYGEELYEQVITLHGPDPDGYAHDYIGAVVHGALEIDALVRDNERGSGWGDILDVDRCPPKGLRWLGQFVGVQLRAPRVVQARTNLFTAPSFEGTAPAYTAPGGFAFFVEDSQASHGSRMAILVRAGTSTTYIRFTDDIPVTGGKTYTVGVDVLHLDNNAVVFINWYDGVGLITQDATALISTLGRVVLTGVAPADAINVQVGIQLEGTVSGQALIFDGVTFEQGSTDGSYFDGDSPTGAWVGVPGESVSSIGGVETGEEWAVYARDAIRRQGNKRRGSPDAMRSAVEDTLTGSRYVNILERVGGNAYALTLVTRPSETPDPAVTLAAALTQKPIGMKITHTMSEGVVIDEGTKTIDSVTGVTIDAATLPDVAD